MRIAFLLLLSCLLATVANAESNEYPVAGEKPDARPQGAPRLEAHLRTTEWYAQALKGVSRPYSLSLRFLEDQGPWYTPFTVPGMTGRYDIRNWHVFSH